MVLFVYRELVGLGSSLGIYTYPGKEFFFQQKWRENEGRKTKGNRKAKTNTQNQY
jgi:hypothetical protein